MKGKILFYDVNNYNGTISGEDGARYNFVKVDWKANGEPRESLEVDFAVEDGKAKDIFLVQGSAAAVVPGEGKSFIVTLLLALFVPIGVHRFYTGHTGIGIVQLITIGGCGIWTIIDLIAIITGSFRDSEGRPLVKG